MKGKTFLPIAQIEGGHLHIIISDPDIDKNVMVVNVTTWHETGREDESCILNCGDHPFIQHKSYITYHYAREINCVKLLAEKFRQTIVFKEDINPSLLKRIQNGAKTSKRLPVKFKKYFDKF